MGIVVTYLELANEKIRQNDGHSKGSETGHLQGVKALTLHTIHTCCG